MNKCRLCNHNKLKKVLYMEDMPTNISVLYEKEDLKYDKPKDFFIYQCVECGFIQAEENKSDTYYKDYVMTVSHSKTMNEYQKKQATSFVDTYRLKGKKIIEVGCGDANFMTYLKKLGVNAVGIEPSKNFRKLAKDAGFDVMSGYVSQKEIIPGAPYDGFVTREVLEHVPDIEDFLKGIFNSLSEGAIGLIEVPCMEKTFENSRFYDFFPDHVNYFTEQTLQNAVTRNGFSVMDLFYGMNKEYINIVVKKKEKPNFNNIKETINKTSEDISRFTDFFDKRGLKVGVRGAGAKGLTVLAICKNKKIECIVDSDSHKQNKYSPVSHIKIVSPKQVNKLDAIILTAMAYKDEILKDLSNKYKFNGTVVVLGDGLEMINNKHYFK